MCDLIEKFPPENDNEVTLHMKDYNFAHIKAIFSVGVNSIGSFLPRISALLRYYRGHLDNLLAIPSRSERCEISYNEVARERKIGPE